MRRLTKSSLPAIPKTTKRELRQRGRLETGDRLEVFDFPVEKGKGQADYLIVSDDLPREEWVVNWILCLPKIPTVRN